MVSLDILHLARIPLAHLARIPLAKVPMRLKHTLAIQHCFNQLLVIDPLELVCVALVFATKRRQCNTAVRRHFMV